MTDQVMNQSPLTPCSVITQAVRALYAHTNAFWKYIELGIQPIEWRQKPISTFQGDTQTIIQHIPLTLTAHCFISEKRHPDRATEWDVYLGGKDRTLFLEDKPFQSFEGAAAYCDQWHRNEIMKQLDLSAAYAEFIRANANACPTDKTLDNFTVITAEGENITAQMPAPGDQVEVLLQNGQIAPASYYFDDPEQWDFVPLDRHGEHADEVFEPQVIAWRKCPSQLPAKQDQAETSLPDAPA